jgi:hypothetical protein
MLMRSLPISTLSVALLGMTAEVAMPASAAPIGNVATLPDRATTGANSLLEMSTGVGGGTATGARGGVAAMAGATTTGTGGRASTYGSVTGMPDIVGTAIGAVTDGSWLGEGKSPGQNEPHQRREREQFLVPQHGTSTC